MATDLFEIKLNVKITYNILLDIIAKTIYLSVKIKY